MNHYEIEACVIRAKNGNREELLKLLEQFKPLIFKTARQFHIKGYDMYDLIQTGYVALINAAAKYKKGSNTFTAYAASSVRNAFRYTARRSANMDEELSLNTPVATDGTTETEFIDRLEAPDNIEENLICLMNSRELRKALAKLPSDEMELVLMVYYNGCSLKTFAEKKGLSYQHIIRKKNRIMEKLRYCLER